MPFFVIKKGLVLLEWKYFPTPKILDPNLSSLQSPQFDSVSSHSNVNTQENNIISSIQAQEYVKETYDIINKSPRIYKIILKNRYLLDQSNAVTMELTRYEQSMFIRIVGYYILLKCFKAYTILTIIVIQTMI